MRIWATVGLSLISFGCGSAGDDGASDGFPAGTSCGVSITLSGGIDDAIPPSEGVACGMSLAFDSGISFGYIPIDGDGPVKSIFLDIEELEKAETGPAFPTRITVHHADDRRWDADGCEVEVVENVFAESDDFADFYRTRGSGSCAVPATSQGGADPDIVISDFDFVVTMPWAQ